MLCCVRASSGDELLRLDSPLAANGQPELARPRGLCRAMVELGEGGMKLWEEVMRQMLEGRMTIGRASMPGPLEGR